MPNSPALPGRRPPGPLPPGVGAFMSTRAGGVSDGPFASLNLGTAVGDDPGRVAENRRRFAAALKGAQPLYLRQVHGARVVVWQAAPAPGAPLEEADAAVTAQPGLACTVQAADCMPVLFHAANGRSVGAAHAGWRGLAAGVLGATAQAVAELAGCPLSEVVAWLGPCIGPGQFEVGPEVLAAFGCRPEAPGPMFLPRARADGSHAWLGNLQGLARQQLLALGLRQISGDATCTVEDTEGCFSFRRDKTTGRMAAAIWLAESRLY